MSTTTLPTNMQAAYITAFGGPDRIHVGELPLPPVTPGTVLIRVKAAAVDRVDAYVRAGTFRTETHFPLILSRDAWGTVVALGPGVTGFTLGQRVWTNSAGYAGRQGVAAQYAVVAANRLWPLPAVDPNGWLALVHPGATAAIIVNQLLNLPAGATLLVAGGAGHVGRLLIQLAKLTGLAVLATCHPRDFATVAALGATPSDYHEGWADHLKAPVAAVVDTSGRVPLQAALDVLAPGGQVIVMATPPTPLASFDLPRFYMQRQRLTGFVISHASLAELTAANDFLTAHAAALQPLAYRTLPLGQAPLAHRLVGDATEKRRLLLIP
ncbi:alcohol dehydrogenase catalytic domain-containing protein [Lacticaseibacillus parakribbianus]|uniref:alcohol dehydrogenase catalytic domain-containing protein n=1 Tax=Lacticaseibacillus parakribbianus TaxID=2970927 RepID=UPI0021CB478E|nr:zinc-binding dehydrogenase [Lacticaseibacillus parakribbianus]